MKNLVYILLILGALACGTWAYCNSRNAQTAEIRLQTQKKQAEANTARAKAMEATEKKEAEKLRKEASDKDFAAKSAAREEAKYKAEEAKADERAMAESRKKAEADAKIADANRKKAEADAAAAKDRRLAAEAAEKYAVATNEARHAELEIAREARIKAELDRKAKEDALAAEELKKSDYENLLKNVRALEATLREREEETRPDRTIKDLLADNEVEAAEVELTPEEIAEKAAAESNRVAKVMRHTEPKTRGDMAIDEAEARLKRIADEGGKVVRAKARARLEALARRAAREGRVSVAGYYLAQAEALFGEEKAPDAKAAEKKDAGEKAGREEGSVDENAAEGSEDKQQ